ncbi:MAG: clostripain-related cysteine peptidase [Pirellula sp.]
MARKWTLMVFLSADNDLEKFAFKDIHEMERIGSNDDVTVVVQIDRSGGGLNQTALRGVIDRDPQWARLPSDVFKSRLADIGETNTGDPKVLEDFIVDSVTRYPAERYGLVIWNHGSGWKPRFMYEAVEKASGTALVEPMKAAGFDELYREQTKRLVFRKTLDSTIDTFIHRSLLPGLGRDRDVIRREFISALKGIDRKSFIGDVDSIEAKELSPLIARSYREIARLSEEEPAEFADILFRAIGLDTTSQDHLDAVELRSALAGALSRIAETGQQMRFSILGFDACLMAGIEICFQIRECADFIVGSEEVEPSTGWSYDKFIEAVQSFPDDPRRIASISVDNYIAALANYRLRLVTQSAIQANSIDLLATKMDSVGRILLPLLATGYVEIARAEKTSTKFFGDKDVMDVGHFLDRLLASAALLNTNDAAIVRDARDFLASNVIVNSRFDFNLNLEAPTGMSIYFPYREGFDSAYETLDLYASFHNWIRFIKSYHFLP